MKEEIARRVVEHLNKFPIPFPKSAKGDEWKLLNMPLEVTDEEGELMIELMPYPEPLDDIAARTGLDKDTLLELLKGLMKKGWVIREGTSEGGKYTVDTWGPGAYEKQWRHYSKEYFEYLKNTETPETAEVIYGSSDMTPWARIIPVGESVQSSSQAIPADDFRRIVENTDAIAVADCMCRTKKKLLEGEHCGKPTEGVCMWFGPYARTMVETGDAREVDKEEALRIGMMCEEAGLIHMATTSEEPMFLCNCCTCCCGPQTAKRQLGYGILNASVYAEVDRDACVACEECIPACEFSAITIDQHADKAVISIEKCVGCGQCFKACQYDAVSMKRREKVIDVPPSWQDFLKIRAKESGRDEYFK